MLKCTLVILVIAIMSTMEQNIPSPCVSVCALNEDDLCMGCYRTADEIRQWGKLSQQEKKQVVQMAHQREKAFNPFL